MSERQMVFTRHASLITHHSCFYAFIEKGCRNPRAAGRADGGDRHRGADHPRPERVGRLLALRLEAPPEGALPERRGRRPGSGVRLAGVTIGKVDDVRLLPPTTNPNEPKVEATFSIKSVIDGKPADDLIRDDSTAQLGSPSLLGSDKVINIIPGTQLGQKVKDGHLPQLGD